MFTEARAVLRSIKRSREVRLSDDFFSSFQSRIWEKDNMPQVFVPAGEFDMGKPEQSVSDHTPEHMVLLGQYWIDALEVSNAQYRDCVKNQGCTRPESVDWMYRWFIFDQYPVVYVTWFQAKEYCIWAGKDLPTEAEWEKAARGTEDLKYPWGSERPNSNFGNFGNGIGTLIASNTYPSGASPYGALNMAGNAREWVSDWFNPTYYQRSPAEAPTGASQGKAKSLRGGGFNDPLDRLMAYNRFSHDPTSPGSNRGFRCVTR